LPSFQSQPPQGKVYILKGSESIKDKMEEKGVNKEEAIETEPELDDVADLFSDLDSNDL